MVRICSPAGLSAEPPVGYNGIAPDGVPNGTLDVVVSKRIFLAGASGAVGRRLVPLLLDAGHAVTGTTRSPEAAERMRELGVTPTILDVRDEAAVNSAMDAAHPDVVIHQLTDLAGSTADDYPEALLASTARLRIEATPILVRAAIATGATRFIAQSSAMLYAPGPEPHREDDPLLTPGTSVVVPGILELERSVRETAAVDGVLLRYGLLYGPGTPTERPDGRVNVHIDAAAWAAALAIDHGTPGVYNIVDDGPVSNAKARDVLGWSPELRLP
jgi:nucleoside-diphosphate-sugar epimerase